MLTPFLLLRPWSPARRAGGPARAGPPSLARGARQGRRRRRRQGGPAPIQEIRADLRKFMFLVFCSSLPPSSIPRPSLLAYPNVFVCLSSRQFVGPRGRFLGPGTVRNRTQGPKNRTPPSLLPRPYPPRGPRDREKSHPGAKKNSTLPPSSLPRPSLLAYPNFFVYPLSSLLGPGEDVWAHGP